MPVLTIRISEQELTETECAARRHKLTKSEFARRAIATAAEAENKTASVRGAWKGRVGYKQAMKMLRG